MTKKYDGYQVTKENWSRKCKLWVNRSGWPDCAENLSIAQVAERATCSPLTVSRIEKGVPTVAIGIYLRVLYALQMDDDILLLAKEDTMGKALQDLSLKKRERASKKHKKKLYVSADFD